MQMWIMVPSLNEEVFFLPLGCRGVLLEPGQGAAQRLEHGTLGIPLIGSHVGGDSVNGWRKFDLNLAYL